VEGSPECSSPDWEKSGRWAPGGAVSVAGITSLGVAACGRGAKGEDRCCHSGRDPRRRKCVFEGSRTSLGTYPIGRGTTGKLRQISGPRGIALRRSLQDRRGWTRNKPAVNAYLRVTPRSHAGWSSVIQVRHRLELRDVEVLAR
jgi:hypothetical protein